MASRLSKVSGLLALWGEGNAAARDELMPLVYGELRKLAGRHMAQERTNHSLQATALVNEAYLRLVEQRDIRLENRAHFFALASHMMRRILVDCARRRRFAKRGGTAQRISLDEAMIVSPKKAPEILALDEALERLSELDPRKSHVVELRYFGGLNIEEIAKVLEVSPITVRRDWSTAKAWLYRAIEGTGKSGSNG